MEVSAPVVAGMAAHDQKTTGTPPAPSTTPDNSRDTSDGGVFAAVVAVCLVLAVGGAGVALAVWYRHRQAETQRRQGVTPPPPSLGGVERCPVGDEGAGRIQEPGFEMVPVWQPNPIEDDREARATTTDAKAA